MNRQCTIEGCTTVEKWLARNMCSKHYTRWRKYGDPHVSAPPRQPLEVRFWSYVDKSGDCWIWTGPRDPRGYGIANWADTQSPLAHRTAYELAVGPIPPGHDLDHLCHTRDTECTAGASCTHRRCVNPAHLEPVTRAENGRRGAARIVRCRNGHEFTAENTGRNATTGARFCRICHRATQQRHQAKRRVA